MQYTVFPVIDKRVSRIFYGTSSAPFLQGKDCDKLLDAVFEAGINTLDTARKYGQSEKVIGNWLKRSGLDKDVVILSKCAHPGCLNIKRVKEKCIREDLEKSCEYLGRNYIDIYLLHRDDERIPAGEIVEWMNALHREGRIGAFGGSNWKASRVREANEYAERNGLLGFSVSSPYYGLGDMIRDPWLNGTCPITGDKKQSDRDYYIQSGIAVEAFGPLASGFFSGKPLGKIHGWGKTAFYGKENIERLRRAEIMAREKGCSVAQLSLAWLYSSKMNMFSALASVNPVRIKENCAYDSVTLTQEERMYLNLGKEG